MIDPPSVCPMCQGDGIVGIDFDYEGILCRCSWDEVDELIPSV